MNNDDYNNSGTHIHPHVAGGIIFLLFLVVLGLGAVLVGLRPIETQSTTSIKPNLENSQSGTVIITRDPFEGVVLEAKAAFVWDVVRNKTLYERNAEAQLPLASLTKLMTALAAHELLPKNAIVTIQNEALTAEGNSGLYANEKWSLDDLLGFTLVVSSNDGASAAALAAGAFKSDFPENFTENKTAFVEYMNLRAGQMGLKQTYFVNETGLDTSDYVGGGYGSARDTAMLFSYIMKHARSIVDVTRYGVLRFLSLDNILHTANNTNKIVNDIPGLIGSKTGFTDLAGGNLVVAFDAGINHPIIISILGSTREGRFRDVEKLIKMSLEKIAQRK